MTSNDKSHLPRPVIANFESPKDYLKEMITYLKITEKSFSILEATKSLRKVSPTLVSLILTGKRNLTLDRADEFAKMLKLTATEKTYLKNWLTPNAKFEESPALLTAPGAPKNRKDVSHHILNDWINVYVKDCFEIPSVQENPDLVYKQLANISSPKRIEKSIQFLLREGHLRKTMTGKIVTEVPLTVTDEQIPSQKVRNFHKGALGIAKEALEVFASNERYANTMILSMTPEKYGELVSLVQEFAENLKDFAADSSGPRLYQVLINLSPTGGKTE